MEVTRISEVYDSFLSKISDYTLLNLTDEEIREDLFHYFKTARTKFYRCKSSLATITDELTDELVFTEEIHPFEIEVLATLMLVEYITPTLNSSEVIKQSLSDKDFKIYSQASQLRELRLLKRELKAEANKMITEYTFFGLDKEESQ